MTLTEELAREQRKIEKQAEEKASIEKQWERCHRQATESSIRNQRIEAALAKLSDDALEKIRLQVVAEREKLGLASFTIESIKKCDARTSLVVRAKVHQIFFEQAASGVNA